MKLRELISLILLNLNRRKGRVMLTAIGVVIGTAAVVVLVSLAQGLKQSERPVWQYCRAVSNQSTRIGNHK